MTARIYNYLHSVAIGTPNLSGLQINKLHYTNSNYLHLATNRTVAISLPELDH
jgi:hypothetical protein